MAKNAGFFTSEMGSWLREMRVQARLTQDEVAARMVLSALRKYRAPELSERLRRMEGYLELHGLDEEIGRQIASLVIRAFAERASRVWGSQILRYLKDARKRDRIA